MDKFSLRKKLTSALSKDDSKIEEEVVAKEVEDLAELAEDIEEEEEIQDDFIEVSETLGLEDTLFPGGPTIGEIEEWKKEYREIY